MESPAELESALDKLTISPAQAHPPAPSGVSAGHHSDQVHAEPSERDTLRWYLKTIDFASPSGKTRSYNIITQNYNGPCSFIAICNILILREQIEILPRDRKSVSYEFLAQLVGEYILLTAPEVDVSAALSMMPLTTKGMDLNPVFTSVTAFRPGTTGGELALFASAGITLVHGWLVDPDSPENVAVSHVGDYDSAVNLIVEADVLTRGRLVSDSAGGDGDGGGAGPSSPNIDLTDEERRKVEDAVAIRTFLDATRSQLTYNGLFTLASLQPASKSDSSPSASTSEPTSTSVEPPRHPELFALFRNSHLAVLYRHPDALYTLVTDQVFLNEPSVVWERLEDVDQGAAVFVDSAFERAAPVGGDWAGWTPETPGTVDPAECVFPTHHILHHHLCVLRIVTSSHCSCRAQRMSGRNGRVPSGRKSVWLRGEETRRRSVTSTSQREKRKIKRKTIVWLCNQYHVCVETFDRGGFNWRLGRQNDRDDDDDGEEMSSDLENGDEDYIEDTEEIDPNVFHIWDPLQKPVTLQYSTEQLHTMIHEGDVDLDPEYQRAVVWSSSKQMAIIDSLFHNYYIPPVVFAISKDPVDGAVTRLCVDGKQRLTSIQKFFDGQIAYRCPRSKKLWWYTTSTATRGSRSEIPAFQKSVFAQKFITCIEYSHLSPAAEREVFQRVQLGMSLTTAEKLQAISSPWAIYITHLEKTHVTIDGGLVDVIAFDDTRGRAFHNVAQLVYCCAGLPAAQRIPSAAKLEKWLTAPDERPSAAFREAVGTVLDSLWELARNTEHDAPFRRFKAKVSPVEFVFIGVLLYTMRNGYTAAEKSRAAFVLRRDIRKAHVDVRFNARVAADCWRIIDAIENGELDIEPPMAAGPPPNAASAPNRRKRKSYDYAQPPSARAPLPSQRAARGKKKRDIY